MTFPDPHPEATAHEQGLITLLNVITYLHPNSGGGGVRGVRVPREAIDFSVFDPPAIVITFTGSMLGKPKPSTMGGCVFDEDFHFEVYTVDASFDVEGQGRVGGVLAGDPGSYSLITDARLAMYGKSFGVVSPWPNSGDAGDPAGPRMVKVFPANPPIQRWDLTPKDDPNRIVYRLNVRTTWLINA